MHVGGQSSQGTSCTQNRPVSTRHCHPKTACQALRALTFMGWTNCGTATVGLLVMHVTSLVYKVDNANRHSTVKIWGLYWFGPLSVSTLIYASN